MRPAGPSRGPGLVEAGLVVMMVCYPVTISGTQIGLALALLGAGVELLRGRPFPRTPLDAPVLAFVAVTVLAAAAGPEPGAALRRLPSLWTILPLYLAAGWLDTPERLVRFLRLLLPTAALVGAYGVYQHFTGHNLLGSGGGGPLHAAELGGRTVYFPRGGFSHYQTFANVYLLLFCLAAALAAGTPRGPARSRRAAVAIFLGVVVVFSFTRGIWLALAVSVAVFCWLAARRRVRGAAVALAAAVLVVTLVPSSLSSRAASMTELGTNVERLLLWETAWNMIRDRPLLGVGAGNFRRFQEEYVRDEVPMLMTRTHTHNVWLQAAVERGIPGLLLLAWLLAAVLARAVAAARLHRAAGGMPAALAAGAAAAVAGFLVDALVQNNLGDSQVAMLFWLVAGVAVVTGRAGAGAERTA